VIKISREYADRLNRAKIPPAERKIIMHNLEKLEDEGYSKTDLISIVIRNIVKDSNFKVLFLKDPFNAIKQTGINPVPTP